MQMQASRGKKYWIIGIVVAVAVVAAGAGGYWYWTSQQEDDVVSEHSGSRVLQLPGDEDANSQTPEEVENSVADTLVSDISKKIVGESIAPTIDGPFGKVGENDFFVRNDSYYSTAAMGTKSQAASNLKAITSELKQQQYKETVRQKGTDTQSYDALFSGATVLCEVYDRKPQDGNKKGYEVGILCADAAQFKETAALLEPYVSAYRQAAKTDVSTRAFYGLRLANSPVDGYRRASLTITGKNQDAQTGYLGVFYQGPDGVWRYFTSTQGIIACSKYDTTEIKYAFQGESCLQTGGKVTTVGN